MTKKRFTEAQMEMTPRVACYRVILLNTKNTTKIIQ